MARSIVRKILIGSLLSTLVIVISLPIGLYEIGLMNIDGRPAPPIQTSNAASDGAFLQQAFRKPEPLAIRVLNPWSYAAGFLTNDDPGSDDGSIAAWVIARDYNESHLRNRRMTFWHLSGAALTIWVSRHWTAEQIVSAAAAITRARPNPKLSAEDGV
jgi:hypothetical protein